MLDYLGNVLTLTALAPVLCCKLDHRLLAGSILCIHVKVSGSPGSSAVGASIIMTHNLNLAMELDTLYI